MVTLHNYCFFCSNGLLYRSGSICNLFPEGGNRNAVFHACYRNSRLATIPLRRTPLLVEGPYFSVGVIRPSVRGVPDASESKLQRLGNVQWSRIYGFVLDVSGPYGRSHPRRPNSCPRIPMINGLLLKVQEVPTTRFRPQRQSIRHMRVI